MSSATVRVSASPTQVRVWAVDNGLILAGQRGRLGAEIIRHYNAAHPVKHVEHAFVKTVRVTAKPEKGRSVTRTVSVKEVRVLAVAAGLVRAGSRGRLPKSVLNAAVLGTLPTV